MQRRTFFKLLAQMSLSALAVAGFPGRLAGAAGGLWPGRVQAALGHRLLAGAAGGLILESLDDGRTWQRIANFGAHCVVEQILEHEGALYARVGLQRFSFALTSADGRTWYTAAAMPRSA